MEQASARDVLQNLAQSSLGSAQLQAEADYVAKREGATPSAELKETIRRVSKRWLPQGKSPPQPRLKCNEPTAEQTDLEDAIERVGGRRGGKAGEARSTSPLLTVVKRTREFATLFRGEYASADPGYYSTFTRKRDAQAFADFLSNLFGHDRLVAMEHDATKRPTCDERDAIRGELDRLRGRHE